MIGYFVPWSMRISNNDMQICLVEGDVVVASVPDYDVGFFFCFAYDFFVFNTCVNYDSIVYVGLVFFAFLDGTPVLVEVFIRSETLTYLPSKVTVRHGMPDNHDLK